MDSVVSPSGAWALEHVQVVYGNNWIGNVPVDEIRIRSVATPARRATVASYEQLRSAISLRWRGDLGVEIGLQQAEKPMTLAAESFGIKVAVNGPQ